MKKILQSLMTLAMLLGITQFGQAQETTYSVTVDWGIPGAVQLKTAGKIIEGIPPMPQVTPLPPLTSGSRL